MSLKNICQPRFCWTMKITVSVYTSSMITTYILITHIVNFIFHLDFIGFPSKMIYMVRYLQREERYSDREGR